MLYIENTGGHRADVILITTACGNRSNVAYLNELLRREVVGSLTPAIAAERLAGEKRIHVIKNAEPSIGPCSAANVNRICAGFYLVFGGVGLFAAASI